VALSQARILYQNHSGDYPQVILTIPVTCRTDTLLLIFPPTLAKASSGLQKEGTTKMREEFFTAG
jgi:hypothetical protein